MPFFNYKRGIYVKCTTNKESIVKADFYKYKSKYYKITRSPIVYGDIAFFSYTDGSTFN